MNGFKNTAEAEVDQQVYYITYNIRKKTYAQYN